MGLRSKSIKKKTKSGSNFDVKITKEDEKNLKFTANDNQLLRAVNEEQPFQEANSHQNNRQSMGVFLASQQNRTDVFGMPIKQPDVSNPSRSRDERPLDTIRSFEYAITGDSFYKEKVETPRLGFRPRPEFPLYNANAYSRQAAVPVSQPVYKPAATPAQPQKKKRGLFGKKKQ